MAGGRPAPAADAEVIEVPDLIDCGRSADQCAIWPLRTQRSVLMREYHSRSGGAESRTKATKSPEASGTSTLNPQRREAAQNLERRVADNFCRTKVKRLYLGWTFEIISI